MYVFEEITEALWAEVGRIQALAYAEYLNEDLEALKQKAQIAGHLCRLIRHQGSGAYCGYILLHPYPANQIPPLNAVFEPEKYTNNDTLFLHDFALDPAFAGTGLGRFVIAEMLKLAKNSDFTTMNLVAVQASAGFWRKFGFHSLATEKDLTEYGDEAIAMTLAL